MIKMVLLSFILSSGAYAAECPINLNGSFKDNKSGPVLVLKQNGCSELTIFDTKEKVTWKIDLTGKTKTTIPAKLRADAKKNASSMLMKWAADSVTIHAKLLPGNKESPLQLTLTGNLPIPNPRNVDEEMLLELRTVFNVSATQYDSRKPETNQISIDATTLAIDGIITSSKSIIPNESTFLEGVNFILDNTIKGMLSAYIDRVK